MLNEIFYAECLVCGCQINFRDILCNRCFNSFEQIVFRCNSCGYPLEVESKFCKNCLSQKYYEQMYIVYWYNSVMRNFMKYVKFHYGLKYKSVFEFLLSNVDIPGDYDYITPVPAHFTRKFRRIIQPAYLISKILSKKYGIKYKLLLKRVKNTKYQWRCKKHERIKNISGAFKAKANLKGLKILLVDDIMTTGATINECSKVLLKNGAKKVDVFCLTKGKPI
ncbi:conserved hypothetical protein [Deferribacter desulfuricans SSM1]|uniref:Phosphoribosyltransferase domain-containing protein n=2 Tax=Deferribacter TaxID=53572 RepID=D3P9F7_DEFDS|nr:conserved hypothetical protein [Deferribacter desulfuricans SSM1]